MWLLWYMTWYDMICAWCGLLCLKAWTRYDMIYVWHEWYDKWYDGKEYTSGVILNDNVNGKMLGPHALLCTHTLWDTPSPSQ